MTYSIRKLADLSGVSTRTLRYYEEIGLLLPSRKMDSGYRFYGEKEINTLQQILFFKERGFELKQIKNLLTSNNTDTLAHSEDHLADLKAKKKRIEAMIDNLERTIQTEKGTQTMTTEEKFQAFKEQKIAENEAQYGAELRKNYGEEAIEQANQRFANMSAETYKHWQELDQKIKALLLQAIEEGWTTDRKESQKIVQLHKEWLQIADKHYTPEKHIGIAQLYITDDRFTAYYDKELNGCAAFLTESINHWVTSLN
ncbi:MerR family transcriptional regulator [Streptococcus sp. zg-86]|uniref:MerR family transcriptional regulator n=1 Tax=Streptococcus zhangguiae TaxID=2664091 RepID=A0A6I4RTD8_9STRE|nr:MULTISPECIES: MerR family transcriptional regulator [unclassified Streptococcus]MTB64175.1 MerR family transcriptional regulator [Streptococcus sp. zg-86]MTB90499.1 MerR family transcriptional regulator [Streptococcus sp. zg-36]MWV56162.1 MerR family transcriptional regulator [Streptococcus sp. zg-70]QTH48216.1 MerR family transcriptional regulator [Streptococcus sp. zg-86]